MLFIRMSFILVEVGVVYEQYTVQVALCIVVLLSLNK